jgi:hypothetical protein
MKYIVKWKSATKRSSSMANAQVSVCKEKLDNNITEFGHLETQVK